MKSSRASLREKIIDRETDANKHRFRISQSTTLKVPPLSPATPSSTFSQVDQSIRGLISIPQGSSQTHTAVVDNFVREPRDVVDKFTSATDSSSTIGPQTNYFVPPDLLYVPVTPINKGKGKMSDAYPTPISPQRVDLPKEGQSDVERAMRLSLLSFSSEKALQEKTLCSTPGSSSSSLPLSPLPLVEWPIPSPPPSPPLSYGLPSTTQGFLYIDGNNISRPGSPTPSPLSFNPSSGMLLSVGEATDSTTRTSCWSSPSPPSTSSMVGGSTITPGPIIATGGIDIFLCPSSPPSPTIQPQPQSLYEVDAFMYAATEVSAPPFEPQLPMEVEARRFVGKALNKYGLPDLSHIKRPYTRKEEEIIIVDYEHSDSDTELEEVDIPVHWKEILPEKNGEMSGTGPNDLDVVLSSVSQTDHLMAEYQSCSSGATLTKPQLAMDSVMSDATSCYCKLNGSTSTSMSAPLSLSLTISRSSVKQPKQNGFMHFKKSKLVKDDPLDDDDDKAAEALIKEHQLRQKLKQKQQSRNTAARNKQDLRQPVAQQKTTIKHQRMDSQDAHATCGDAPYILSGSPTFSGPAMDVGNTVADPALSMDLLSCSNSSSQAQTRRTMEAPEDKLEISENTNHTERSDEVNQSPLNNAVDDEPAKEEKPRPLRAMPKGLAKKREDLGLSCPVPTPMPEIFANDEPRLEEIRASFEVQEIVPPPQNDYMPEEEIPRPLRPLPKGLAKKREHLGLSCPVPIPMPELFINVEPTPELFDFDGWDKELERQLEADALRESATNTETEATQDVRDESVCSSVFFSPSEATYQGQDNKPTRVQDALSDSVRQDALGFWFETEQTAHRSGTENKVVTFETQLKLSSRDGTSETAEQYGHLPYSSTTQQLSSECDNTWGFADALASNTSFAPHLPMDDDVIRHAVSSVHSYDKDIKEPTNVSLDAPNPPWLWPTNVSSSNTHWDQPSHLDLLDNSLGGPLQEGANSQAVTLGFWPRSTTYQSSLDVARNDTQYLIPTDTNILLTPSMNCTAGGFWDFSTVTGSQNLAQEDFQIDPSALWALGSSVWTPLMPQSVQSVIPPFSGSSDASNPATWPSLASGHTWNTTGVAPLACMDFTTATEDAPQSVDCLAPGNGQLSMSASDTLTTNHAVTHEELMLGLGNPTNRDSLLDVEMAASMPQFSRSILVAEPIFLEETLCPKIDIVPDDQSDSGSTAIAATASSPSANHSLTDQVEPDAATEEYSIKTPQQHISNAEPQTPPLGTLIIPEASEVARMFEEEVDALSSLGQAQMAECTRADILMDELAILISVLRISVPSPIGSQRPNFESQCSNDNLPLAVPVAHKIVHAQIDAKSPQTSQLGDDAQLLAISEESSLQKGVHKTKSPQDSNIHVVCSAQVPTSDAKEVLQSQHKKADDPPTNIDVSLEPSCPPTEGHSRETASKAKDTTHKRNQKAKRNPDPSRPELYQIRPKCAPYGWRESGAWVRQPELDLYRSARMRIEMEERHRKEVEGLKQQLEYKETKRQLQEREHWRREQRWVGRDDFWVQKMARLEDEKRELEQQCKQLLRAKNARRSQRKSHHHQPDLVAGGVDRELRSALRLTCPPIPPPPRQRPSSQIFLMKAVAEVSEVAPPPGILHSNICNPEMKLESFGSSLVDVLTQTGGFLLWSFVNFLFKSI